MPRRGGSILVGMSQHSLHRLGCRPADHPSVGRRELLQVGSLSLLGTGLADLLRLEAQASEPVRTKARAKSVVFIFPLNWLWG